MKRYYGIVVLIIIVMAIISYHKLLHETKCGFYLEFYCLMDEGKIVDELCKRQSEEIRNLLNSLENSDCKIDGKFINLATIDIGKVKQLETIQKSHKILGSSNVRIMIIHNISIYFPSLIIRDLERNTTKIIVGFMTAKEIEKKLGTGE